jgi:hypothetical protein
MLPVQQESHELSVFWRKKHGMRIAKPVLNTQ